METIFPDKMKMTESRIQKALLSAFHSHDYKFTNVYYFNNESDWLSFLSSGFCYEVEIKISRSDFKADFKKEKHVVHQSNSGNSKTFIQKRHNRFVHNPSWEMCRLFPELIDAKEYFEDARVNGEWQRISKIRLYMQMDSAVEFVERKNQMLPNKFFYAVPTGLITKEVVPEYAGLLYVDEDLNVTKVKDGKFLHKDKLDVKKLFNKTYYSYLRELHLKLKES